MARLSISIHRDFAGPHSQRLGRRPLRPPSAVIDANRRRSRLFLDLLFIMAAGGLLGAAGVATIGAAWRLITLFH